MSNAPRDELMKCSVAVSNVASIFVTVRLSSCVTIESVVMAIVCGSHVDAPEFVTMNFRSNESVDGAMAKETGEIVTVSESSPQELGVAFFPTVVAATDLHPSKITLNRSLPVMNGSPYMVTVKFPGTEESTL